MRAERKRLTDDQRHLRAQEVAAERKRARLLEKAKGLSTDDLLQILADRQQAQAAAKAKAMPKAKGKGKAKSKAKADA